MCDRMHASMCACGACQNETDHFKNLQTRFTPCCRLLRMYNCIKLMHEFRVVILCALYSPLLHYCKLFSVQWRRHTRACQCALLTFITLRLIRNCTFSTQWRTLCKLSY